MTDPKTVTVQERLRAQLDAHDPIYTKGVTGARSRELAFVIQAAIEALSALTSSKTGDER